MRSLLTSSLLAAPLLSLFACDGCAPPDGNGGPTDGGLAGLVVVNELMASNAGAHLDEFGEADDWIELYNPGERPVDLEGFGLSDDATEPAKHVFAAGIEIPPGGFLVVWADRQPFQGPLHADFRLAREGEEVLLTAPGGEEVDHVIYGALEPDQSWGRFPDGEGEPGSLGTPTPGAPNLVGLGDAGPVDAGPGGGDAGPDDAGPSDGGAAARDVALNEILVAPTAPLVDLDGDPVTLPWIELVNTGDAVADLSGHYLSDDPAFPTRSPLGAFARLQPGERLVVFANSSPASGADHVTLRLEAEGGTVVLASPAGEVLDRHDYGAQAPGVSEGRSPDGSGPFVAQKAPSPREANVGPPSDDAGVLDGGLVDGGLVDGGVDDGGLADAGLADGG